MSAQNFGKNFSSNNQVSEEALRKFNWGAFFMPFLWGIWYKKINMVLLSVLLFIMTIAFIVYVIAKIAAGLMNIGQFMPNTVLTILENVEKTLPSIIFGFIFIVLLHLFFCFYFGKKGNRWAWQNKSYANEPVFESAQRKWAIFGTIFKGIPVTLFLLWWIAVLVALPIIVDTFKQSANKMFFVDAYLKLQEATISAQKGNNGSMDKYLYDEKGLVSGFYVPYFSVVANKGVGFITEENYMYAFKIINKECGNYPDNFGLKDQGQACAQVHIDINGQEGLPNKDSTMDKINDRFVLYIFQNGVVAPKDTIEYAIINGDAGITISHTNTQNMPENAANNSYADSFVKSFGKIENAVSNVVKDTNKPLSEIVTNKALLLTSFSKYLSIKEIKSDGFVDKDGTYFKIQFLNSYCPEKPQGTDASDACIRVVVDVNSAEPPNQMSVTGEISDRFALYGYSEGLYPAPKSVEAKLLGR